MFIVLEIQTNADGAVATLVDAFADRNQAEQKYHTILSYAAISELPKHAAVMLDEEGRFIKAECYEHGDKPAVPEVE